MNNLVIIQKKQIKDRLVRYLQKTIESAAKQYNSGEKGVEVVAETFNKKDKVFSCYYHNIGLEKEFLINLDAQFKEVFIDSLCVAFHVLHTFDQDIPKTHINKNCNAATCDNAYGHVYVIEKDNGHVKIGSSLYPEKRIRNIEYMSGAKMVKVWISPPHSFYTQVEHSVHKDLSKNRVFGEWFDIDFKLAKKRVEAFAELHGKTFIPAAQAAKRLEA